MSNPAPTSTSMPTFIPPSRAAAWWFSFRANGLRLRRGAKNVFVAPVRQHRPAENLTTAPIIGERRTPLFTHADDRDQILTLGKIENLRRARLAFDGVEIAAGDTLSFWRQIGRLSASRGYVEGNEIREGCAIPAIGGGVCQLTNSLAHLAQAAGFTFVERHSHTRKLNQNASASNTLDATVFWNYLDLRISAPRSWRIEVALTSDELIVRLRAQSATAITKLPAVIPLAAVRATDATQTAVRGCLSCEEVSCFRHQALQKHPLPVLNRDESANTLCLLAPHFSTRAGATMMGWLAARISKLPLENTMQSWRPSASTDSRMGTRFKAVSIAAALWLRATVFVGRLVPRVANGGRQAAILCGHAWLADAYAKALKPWHTTIIVDQVLLPFLERRGVLAGRKIEVIATTLPMQNLQALLTKAATAMTAEEALQLNDFRVEDDFVRAEIRALRAADRIVTTHSAVAQCLANATKTSAELLQIVLPNNQDGQPLWTHSEPASPLILVFPASELLRKGVHIVARAASLLAALNAGRPIQVWVLGSADKKRGASYWAEARAAGVAITHRRFDSDWCHAAAAQGGVLVLPAIVEHQPRALLQAATAGVPAVCSTACGLTGVSGVTEIAMQLDNIDADAVRFADAIMPIFARKLT